VHPSPLIGGLHSSPVENKNDVEFEIDSKFFRTPSSMSDVVKRILLDESRGVQRNLTMQTPVSDQKVKKKINWVGIGCC